MCMSGCEDTHMIGDVDVAFRPVQLSHNGGLVANGGYVKRRVSLLQTRIQNYGSSERMH